MSVHPDKTAARAVDACGGVYSSAEEASGYADGHRDALDAAREAVKNPDALMADLLEALRPFAATAAVDIGEDEADCDIFQQPRVYHNRAPKITVGDMRRALAAVAKATGDA